MNKSFSVKHPITIVALELLLALPFGFVLTQLGVGAMAWLFGGIAAGALVFNAYRIFYGSALKTNRNTRLIGQTLVGLAIGFSIANGNLADLSARLPIFGFLTLFILLTGTLIGYFYSQISRTNLLNAMLATVPGGVGVMSSIAADYGRNVSLVALVQVIRVTAVVITIPLLARASAGDSGNTIGAVPQNLFNINLQSLPILFLALVMAFVGVRIASRLRIPAAPFFGPLVIGIIFNPLLSSLPFVADIYFSPPRIVSLLGQVLLGITIGEYWGNQSNFSKKTIGYALIPVGMTIGAGLIAAAIAMRLTSWDWLTCMLVTAPGGAAEMILVALAMDHNVEVVTAGHLVRLMAINASLPLWVLLFNHLDRYFPSSETNEELGISR